MKTTKLIFLALALSISSAYSQRVLTDAERITLLNSATFLQHAQMAIYNQAVYWGINHDGSGDIDGNGTSNNRADKIAFAKKNAYATYLIDNGISDPKVALTFLLLSQGRTFSLGSAPIDEASLLAVWTDGVYEEFAISYFNLKVSQLTSNR